MRKLEEFVTEKLKISKGSISGSKTPDLIAILTSKYKEDYKSKCQQISEYLKNDSDLPVAELKDSENGLKKLARKYQNSYDTFLYVSEDFICYGTWDDKYSINWSRFNDVVRNYYINENERAGFKNFAVTDKELSESSGVYIITENKELLEQIDYLIQKSEPVA